MNPIAPEWLLQRRLQLLDLPRELRDEIYKHCCNPSPGQNGALKGFVDLPSLALLRVSKQIRAECGPIFQDALEHTLLKHNVCLKMKAEDSDHGTMYACWSIWRTENRRFLSVGVRQGVDGHGIAAWWTDARRVAIQDIDKDSRSSTEWMQSLTILAEVLDKLRKVAVAKDVRVRSRLQGVQGRVSEVVRAVCDLEERKSASPEESRPHEDSLPAFNAYNNVIQDTMRTVAAIRKRDRGSSDQR